MSLTALVACLALQAAPLEPGPDAVEPARKAAFTFDELPAPPRTSDDVRVRRFLGAFAGGVVGLGAAFALMPALAPECFAGFGPCIGGWQVFLGSLAPLIAATGAWAGYSLLGGDGGWLTPLAGLAPAALVGLWLANLANQMGAVSTVEHLPYLVGTGVVFAAGAALALELRARQLERLGGGRSFGTASAGRVAVSALVAAASGASVFGTAALLGALASFSGLLAPVVIGVSLAGAVAVGAATWGVHRGLGGKGSFASALIGLALGGALSGGGTLLFMLSATGGFNPLINTSGALVLAQLAIASVAFFPVMALEWSHADVVSEELPRVSIGAAPLDQGGLVSAAVRF